jgi:hypothetical protein
MMIVVILPVFGQSVLYCMFFLFMNHIRISVMFYNFLQLTAGNLHGAPLPVHGVQLQVHGTGQGQRDPETEINIHRRQDNHRTGQGQR